jgi:hypothetical protein
MFATQPTFAKEEIMSHSRSTGFWMVMAGVLAGLGYLVLGTSFGWPAVLDEPGTVALPLFAQAETAIRLGFLAQLGSSLALLVAAVHAQSAWGRATPGDLTITVFGVLGATIQTFGWARWPVVVPGLSDLYATAATEAERSVVAADYDLLNAYAGGTLGEFLGWLFQAVWAVGFATWLWKRSGLPRWLTGLGLAVSWGWAVTLPTGIALGLGAVEFVGVNVYPVWFLWILVVGGTLAARRTASTADPASAPLTAAAAG